MGPRSDEGGACRAETTRFEGRERLFDEVPEEARVAELRTRLRTDEAAARGCSLLVDALANVAVEEEAGREREVVDVVVVEPARAGDRPFLPSEDPRRADGSSLMVILASLALETRVNASCETRAETEEGSERRDAGLEEMRRVERKMARKWVGEVVGVDEEEEVSSTECRVEKREVGDATELLEVGGKVEEVNDGARGLEAEVMGWLVPSTVVIAGERKGGDRNPRRLRFGTSFAPASDPATDDDVELPPPPQPHIQSPIDPPPALSRFLSTFGGFFPPPFFIGRLPVAASFLRLDARLLTTGVGAPS